MAGTSPLSATGYLARVARPSCSTRGVRSKNTCSRSRCGRARAAAGLQSKRAFTVPSTHRYARSNVQQVSPIICPSSVLHIEPARRSRLLAHTLAARPTPHAPHAPSKPSPHPPRPLRAYVPENVPEQEPPPTATPPPRHNRHAAEPQRAAVSINCGRAAPFTSKQVPVVAWSLLQSPSLGEGTSTFSRPAGRACHFPHALGARLRPATLLTTRATAPALSTHAISW